MNSEDFLMKLKDSIVEGEPQNTIESMEEVLKLGLDAKVILNEAIIKAADEVGILYEKEEYFLADLLMSGDALKAAMCS